MQLNLPIAYVISLIKTWNTTPNYFAFIWIISILGPFSGNIDMIIINYID